IIAQFRANGLEGVFNVKSELADALEFAGLPKPAPPPPKRSTMNVQFINPFINATQLTLERQAKTKLTAGKPFARTDQAAVQDFEIAGVINLASNVFQGSIALCFPEKVFIAIYANMVGEKHPRITQEMEDSASELLNIIFGMAKAELDSVGMKIEKAIPTVVRGSQLRVFQANRAVAIILPFQTDAGPFHVEIGVNPI
ncbi:MAG: chemotaxis protein CheX, partial [Bdellovibrionota bacterium]